MKLRILTEASGSLTAAYVINSIKAAGHICVASDIDANCFGRYLADDFVQMPQANEDTFWKKLEQILVAKQIDVVLPSLDQTLLGWSERKPLFREKGINVITSDAASVAICQDKWLTFQFFKKYGIPTPETRLTQDFPLVKPRLGRGAMGVKVTSQAVDMEGMISQELLSGVEFTIDVFCDRNAEPVYIVPRRRQHVRDGKSTGGIVEKNEKIISWVKTICQKASFYGPINIQCFICPDGTIKFVEINPRIAGGMALGFAATENWIALAIRNLIHGESICVKPVIYGMQMRRYYAEVFVPPR